MTDNLKEFLQKASADDKLAKELQELQNEEDKDKVISRTIELAKDEGTSLTEADFEMPAGELDEEELMAVSGGWKSCICAFGGGGKADWLGKAYACVLGGGGESKAGSSRCVCVLEGFGYRPECKGWGEMDIQKV